MKKLLLSSVAIAAITLAVDGPAKAAPATYSWTGCYVGGNVGDAWAHKDFSTDLNGTFSGHGPQSMSHVAGGVQAGCDYQYGMWVFGAQGMFDWTDMNGRGPFNAGKGYTTHIPWFATAAGRVGYLAQPNFLFFVKGGAAFVRDEHLFFDPIPTPTRSAKVTRTGSLIGGGVEWMFTPYWSVSIEYDYMSFGNKVVVFQSLFGGPPGGEHISQNMQTVLVSLNYRFGTGGWPR
jgi:outer membrane immunogenic protein